MLTMFAMVLAIGLLVDDAIVVVENVERIMSEEGLSPLEATRKSMEQITSALVGIGLVLSAVFGPMIFFPGSTGVIYRQFSVTVIASMLLSVVVALVLTPVLCAVAPEARRRRGTRRPRPASAPPAVLPLVRPVLLRAPRHLHDVGRPRPRQAGPLRGRLRRDRRARWRVLYLRMPTGYLPDEDQGTLMAMVQLPVGSTLEQTEAVMQRRRAPLPRRPEGRGQVVRGDRGDGLRGRGQNQGMVFVQLKDWKLRNRPGLRARRTSPARR